MFFLPSFDVTSSSKRWRMREGKGFILSNKVIAIWESNTEDYMGSWRRSCFWESNTCSMFQLFFNGSLWNMPIKRIITHGIFPFDRQMGSMELELMGRIGEELDIDFVVSTGDNFYEDGLTGVDDKAFEESFTDIYTSKSLQKQWYSVLGNHDYRGDVLAQLSPVLRNIDSRWLCLRNFILNAEIVDFFFVDTTPLVESYWTNPEVHHYDWREVAPRENYIPNLLKDLDAALKESTAPWKIVVGHHTMRSVSDHGDTPELLALLLPVLKDNGVDLYVNGHDHCLEHISSKDSPIQYLTSGGGSKAWRGVFTPNSDKLQFFHDGQGFMSLQLTEAAANIVFYDVFGQELYQWSVTKNLHAAE